MSLFQYDPSKVLLNWNGVLITGYQDGTFVTIEYTEANFMTHVGSLGDVTRTRNLSKLAKMSITLMAQAPCNDLLMAKALLDLDTGVAYGPLSFSEINGNTSVHGAYAWCEKIPTIERAKESGPVKWEFMISAGEIQIGGAVGQAFAP